MRKSILRGWFIALWTAALMCSIAYGQGAATEKALTKIAQNVYSYVDATDGSAQNSFGANAGIVVGEKGIMVIDTLVSAKEAQRFIRDIKAVSERPVRYVVDTHYHLDHAFGNAEFAKMGAEIISHANCKANMENAGEDTLKNAGSFGLSEEDMEGTKIAYPSMSFTDRMVMDMGGVEVDLIFVAPSHSSGSILVYLPGERVLFAGDVLFTDVHPFMGEGDIDGWLRTLEYIESLDVEKIIPGHGPVSAKKDVTEMKEYLVAFDRKARELSAESDDIEYIVSEIKKSLPQRSLGEWLMKANIQMRYMKGKGQND